MSGQIFRGSGSPSSSPTVHPSNAGPFSPLASGTPSPEFPYSRHNPGRLGMDSAVNASKGLQRPAMPLLPEQWSYLQMDASANQGGGLLSERDLKTLKRKQANRDAARRSKIRRKLEAQELGARRKELHSEGQCLKTEVAELHSEVLKLAELNKSHRRVLAARGVDLGSHPIVKIAFEPPSGLQGAEVNGEQAVAWAPGPEAAVSIPEVLEFSQEFGAQFGLSAAKFKHAECSTSNPRLPRKGLEHLVVDLDHLEDPGTQALSSLSTDKEKDPVSPATMSPA